MSEPFSTAILDAALERRRNALEEERRAIVARVWQLLDSWAPVYGIRQAYLFGSAAKPGRFHEDSDVDIAVEQIDGGAFFRAMATFSRDLRRTVDLVELADCHFADKIRREGIAWKRSG